MSENKISVVTFDLWDTVFIDDSDEPKRQSQGLAPKPVERRNLVESFLNKHKPVSRELVDIAYSTTDAAFRHVWYGQNITWTVKERLSVLLKGLGWWLGLVGVMVGVLGWLGSGQDNRLEILRIACKNWPI